MSEQSGNQPRPNLTSKPKSSWIDRRDFVGLCGVALIGYGAWLIFPPAGFIASGVILAGVAIFGVKG
mgnify:CR=1 FL=1